MAFGKNLFEGCDDKLFKDKSVERLQGLCHVQSVGLPKVISKLGRHKPGRYLPQSFTVRNSSSSLNTTFARPLSLHPSPLHFVSIPLPFDIFYTFKYPSISHLLCLRLSF